jgi:hypothetical protein
MKRVDLVGTLLLAGADMNIENGDKLTPKQIADQMEDKQTAAAIKNICDILRFFV